VDWGIEELNHLKEILNKSSTFQEQFVHPLALEHTIQSIMEFVYDNESILKYNIEVFQKGKKNKQMSKNSRNSKWIKEKIQYD